MVSIIEVLPYTQSVVPTIKVKVEESIPSNTMLFKVDGIVLSQDCKFISHLKEMPTQTNNQRSEVVDLARGTYMNTPTHKELIFTLDKNVLDYIEELRYNHPSESVVLRFELNVILLLHALRLGGFKPDNAGNREPAILSSPYDPTRADYNLNILVTPESHSIFTYQVTHDIKEYEIGSGQWVSDFHKPLGIGDYLVTPISPYTLKDISEQQLPTDEIKFRKRLVKAYQTLSEMQRLLRMGEWGSVVKQSRELLELFEKDETKFIKETLVQTTGILEDKSQSLIDGIGKLYDYANGLHHSVITKGEQRGDPMPQYHGGKEDAYMVYSLSTSIVNLLTKKFESRISNNS